MKLRAAIILPCIPLLACGAEYGATPYDITPLGARTVYIGQQALVPFWVTYRPGGMTRYFYYDEIRGVPPGVTAEVYCVNDNRSPCTGTPLQQNYPYAEVSQAIRVTASEEAAPGEYTLMLHTHDYEGHSLVAPIPLRVARLPETPATPAWYQPPIPTLELWRQKMVTEGARFCNASNKSQTFAFGYEGSVWYYDGARVFYQIHDATGEDIWRQCAENVASQYADYVNNSCQDGVCGGVPGWRVFPRGLRMAYERTGQDKYRQAVENLAANGRYTQRPGHLVDLYIRETAYAADSLLEARLIHSPHYETVYVPKLRILVDELLAMYETLFERERYGLHQPFYDALAAEALIDYYRFVQPDPRIPPAIKKMLDWTWEVAWDQQEKRLSYQPEGVPLSGANDLLGLTVPAFAWYYSITGDLTYLQRGDELFGHIFDTELWSGKQFSQTFRWTFDYVKWRSPASGHVGITVPERLYPSGRAEATIRLPGIARGKCGEAVRFTSVPELLGWPKVVPLKPGTSARTVRIRPQAVGEARQVAITAQYRSLCGEPSVSGTAVTTWGPDHLAIELFATRVPGGMIPNNRVAINGPPMADGAPIALSTDRPDLVRFFDMDGRQVSSIPVAGGKGRSHFFYVDTGYVTTPTPVTVSASAGGLTGSATLVVEPPAPRLMMQNGPKLVSGFETCFNQVVIHEPAPPGGMAVDIWTSNKSHLATTLHVTVPEGAISTTFCATPELTGEGEGTAHISYGRGKYAIRHVEAEKRTLKFTDLPATIRSGTSATGKLGFDSWIPRDTAITLTSDDPAITVSGALTIQRSTERVPAQGTFTIKAGAVTGERTATIQAASETGHKAVFSLKVTP